MTTFDIKLDQ